MTIERPKIGIDVGGVIIDKVNDGTDTSFFSNNYLNTTAVPGAFAAISTLGERKFGSDVYIISKCGEKTEEKTRAWLEHHGFYAQTGVNPEHVLFCRRREDKGPIASEIGLTHFVDDKLEVLSHMGTVAQRYLFRPEPAEVRSFQVHLASTIWVQDWSEIVQRELPDLLY